MSKLKDLTGQKFGRLTVIELAGKNNYNQAIWLCECECGEKTEVFAGNLRRNRTKSCGCLNDEYRKKDAQKLGTIGQYRGTKIQSLTSKLFKNNTSGYKGVLWREKYQKWESTISLQGKRRFLGYFDNKEDAIKARQEAEEKYFKPIIEEYKNIESEDK